MLRLAGLDRLAVGLLLARYGLELRLVSAGEDIPGSYWGECEAGLKDSTLYARLDTPLHSVLHESAHFICMSAERRAGLDRDAGGDDAEECAVCYLQLLLSAELPQCGLDRACADMDEWGYSFRLGSTRAWYEQDAADARLWLLSAGIIDAAGRLTFQLRAG
ncbi:MAG: hypothetical protein QM696_12805 [Steroidobacteraceae bacterium]